MASSNERFVFRLYSADRSEEMDKLMERLKEVVAAQLGGEVKTEVIDVLRDPERAVRENVFGTPMLIKDMPEPSQRVLGDLSDPHKILVLFGLLEKPPGD
jgi:circadian clock protein KaiB